MLNLTLQTASVVNDYGPMLRTGAPAHSPAQAASWLTVATVTIGYHPKRDSFAYAESDKTANRYGRRLRGGQNVLVADGDAGSSCG